PSHFVSADTATLQDLTWLEMQWEAARQKVDPERGGLFIIDEVQKIPKWSLMIKKLWDEDTRNQISLKVMILGSSPWLMQKGLSESLAGRFEIFPITHWSFYEMQKVFGWGLDEFIYFGGYPGCASLISEEARWRNYINDALVETTISRDILLMAQVNKPALLRRLFQLGCEYSGQILSFQKMVGQLQDAGNTTTLSHYLEFLTGAGVLTGLSKYAKQTVRRKGSSPKFQVFNTALMSAQSGRTFEEAKEDKVFWGRLTESAVGATLVNGIRGTQVELSYWKEGTKEVDFVLKKGQLVVAFEVKSGDRKEKLSGMNAFKQAFPKSKLLLVGNRGISLEDFFKTPILHWFS
ncbi:MAG: ATP-binding protein, partial [Simkania sp.]|nr:ATP-binding protein [Simkania sp.]